MNNRIKEQEIELRRISKQMQQALEKENFNERNYLCEQWCKCRSMINYGYRVGDRVEYLKGKRDWKEGFILAIDESWQITFKDVVLPVEFIRPIQRNTKYEPPQQEQLSLF